MYRIGLICFASAVFAAAEVLTPLRGAAAAATDAPGVDFFEKRIRPLLAEHCYECHSAQSTKVKGGLLLDTREGLRKGGDTGPAIAAGDPDQSLLIKAVRYTDENLQMPPKNRKLSDDQIHDLEQWVRLGAPDPRGTVAVKPAAPAEKHWAFQPVRRPASPSVRNQRWGQTPVDAFILAQLESRGLGPSRRADKRVLLRRATYDLTGLPPTEDEIAAFLADASEDAFTRVVDRLLGSPRYGERWARHWLDIARYADTKGYVFEEERRYAYAYTYRDYVIQAFNDDLPYDQFVLHQVAADALALGDDKRPLAALGFLTLGRRFLNNPHDIIDDRIDVVSRGLLGLTVSCARCHDHKYDPIPTQDYYSWYGVFSSSSEPAEKPLLGTVTANPEYQQFLAERKKREHEYEDFRRTKETEALDQVRRSVADYLLVVRDAARQEDAAKIEGIARQRKLDPNVAGRWRDTIKKSAHQAVFAPWIALMDIPDPEFAPRAAELAPGYAANTNAALLLNRRVVALFQPAPPASAKELADRYGKLFLEVHEQWQKLLIDATNAVVQVASTNAVLGAPREKPAPAALTDPEAEQLRQLLYGPESPTDLSAGEVMRLFDVPTAQKVRRLRRELEQLDATHPGAPARAMALQDNPTPRSARVFIRGNPNNPGPEVPRQFLSVLSRGPRRPFTRGSGRLELAQAIADANNPLTARVLVNRVWLQHFGAGIVRSPSDFGTRADPPSHPELLDYLAWRFMAEGWSIKKLHRLIMLSSVYQQASDDHPASYRIDPVNQWLWRMNRRRLEFEAMRDTVLAVSGRLDLTVGGRPVDITTEPFPPRRTVYGFVERQNLPGLFRTFDFASPDTSSPQRFYTTIPQQALFMLNSPFLIEHSRALLQTSEVDDTTLDRARIEGLYRKSLQRTPTSDELRLASRFIERQQRLRPRAPAEDAWVYGCGTYDPAAERVTHFEPLPHFTGNAWQGGSKLPDPNLGWVMLNADGGHPGLGLTNVAIRRWIAPTAGTVRIKGDLAHDAKEGDGVRGLMISSRASKLGEWIVHQNKTEVAGQLVAVQPGDTLDFLVDCRATIDSDSFHWTVVVDYERSLYERAPAEQTVWSSKPDFSGPQKRVKPLDAWEKLAQVLLMSNELMFVD